MKLEAAVDDNGAPLLLVAGAAVADPKPKPEEEVKPQPKPDASQGSGQRRRDSVVDAARTLEDLSPAGVEQFVRRRWAGRRALAQEDIDTFSADARAQRLHDVVDALDHRIRKAVTGRAGSRQPHVVIPRGLQRKSLAALDAEEVTEVFARLRDRGWNTQQIKRYGIRRLDSNDGKLQGLLKG
jgi:uncharacterized protein YdcH (DUF465 family)